MTSFPLIEDYSLVLSLPSPNQFVADSLQSHLGQSKLHSSQYGQHFAAGGFAVVYRFQGSSARYALRCPIQKMPNGLRLRYTKLNEFAQRNNNPSWLVDSSYIDEALFVKQAWRPVVVMQWVSGKTLQDECFSLNQRGDKCGFEKLYHSFLALISQMRQQGISHGDLQPANIMIESSTRNLVLIDYDTIHIRGEAGLSGYCPVAGCPGYTHPKHLKGIPRLMDERLDDFAQRVISISLQALAHDPALFGRYSSENLLFPAEAFEFPYNHDSLNRTRQINTKLRDEVDALIADLESSNTIPVYIPGPPLPTPPKPPPLPPYVPSANPELNVRGSRT